MHRQSICKLSCHKYLSSLIFQSHFHAFYFSVGKKPSVHSTASLWLDSSSAYLVWIFNIYVIVLVKLCIKLWMKVRLGQTQLQPLELARSDKPWPNLAFVIVWRTFSGGFIRLPNLYIWGLFFFPFEVSFISNLMAVNKLVILC